MRMGLLSEEAKNIKPLNDTRRVQTAVPHSSAVGSAAGASRDAQRLLKRYAERT